MLIRGRRLDGPSGVAFVVSAELVGLPRASGPRFVSELRTVVEPREGRWQFFAHSTALRQPTGCYTLQADGPGYSVSIVFGARPPEVERRAR